MDIRIISKRATKQIKLLEEAGFTVIDVTSKSDTHPQFSPFYSYESGIPIPGSSLTSRSVEGIWQGLKVFENAGVDHSKFTVANMKNLKRTVRKNGKVLGHLFGEKLIDYVTARKVIYIPSYNYVLDNFLQEDIKALGKISKLVLLDYDTNEDVENTAKPLSHASLIKKYLLRCYS